ncbi:MAG: ribosome biogenesis GTPase Der [Bacillales bacterium]|nr:ribosome biogenesis GTPase Der [Bacillales bacterium]MDY6003533.1 ribosome biogenesis GTPase Der [Bacilli bacterium]
MNNIGTVAVVGSPNVGKSTIFNRIIGHRHAIIDDQPGVTRDRIYDKASWLGVDFNIIDTGGIEIANRPFQEQIRAQATIAIEEADVIVFVTDGKVGISKDDRIVAKMLYKSNKPIILAVNKIDNLDMIHSLGDFYALGLGEPLPVSGEHGIGIGDLLDKIVNKLPKKEDKTYDDAITFSIIGRPNVGKSSLSNAILNKERVIVSNIEGTTRDSIDTRFTRDNQDYVVIDTAGLKKRGKIFESVDKYSMLRALGSIDRSEIVLLVLDAETGIQEQDKHIVGYAVEAKKAIIIVVNKWDTVERSQNAQSDFEKKVRKEFQFLDYAPIVFVSAKNKTKIDNIFKAINKVHLAYDSHVQTSILNDVIQDAQTMNPAPEFNKGRLRIYFANQASSQPPSFVMFVNKPKYAHFSYIRYIENRLRETFDLDGTPIEIVLREKV